MNKSECLRRATKCTRLAEATSESEMQAYLLSRALFDGRRPRGDRNNGNTDAWSRSRYLMTDSFRRPTVATPRRLKRRRPSSTRVGGNGWRERGWRWNKKAAVGWALSYMCRLVPLDHQHYAMNGAVPWLAWRGTSRGWADQTPGELRATSS